MGLDQNQNLIFLLFMILFEFLHKITCWPQEWPFILDVIIIMKISVKGTFTNSQQNSWTKINKLTLLSTFLFLLISQAKNTF